MSPLVALVAACAAAAAALALHGVGVPPARSIGAIAGGTADRRDDAVAAFEQAARDLRAGSSVRHAVLRALEHRPAVLPGLHRDLDSDRPLAESLDRVHPTGDTELFVHALHVMLRTDAEPAEVLDRAVLIARERRAWRAERQSQAAQARLSARLLTMLPLAFAVWSTATSGRVRDAELHQPVVAVCLVVGAALNAAGWWWMRRLVRGGVP